MRKFILSIDSLVRTFSIVEAGKDILFIYQDKVNTAAFKSVSNGDLILGFFSEPINLVKCVFEVKEVKGADSLVLNKLIEVAEGAALESAIAGELEKQTLIEIPDESYRKIVSELVLPIKSFGEASNIFEGFAPWLTSYDNPDYTGKEKYEGYPRALKRLTEFMKERGLIDDSNLNDKNVDKYKHFLIVYNSSEEVREYDKTMLSDQAGRAALKKYIKYIEHLLSPKATVFDYSTTKGRAINMIFDGTPGCGKSYHVEHVVLGKDKVTKEYKGDYSKDNIIRTTFYQDYSNTDFVGQILPKIVRGGSDGKDSVEYIFNPGPFTLALIRAISNPSKKVALVIEEINRGNAPAIFGDIFQLLDRDENGVSEYGIVNVSVMDYLNDYTFEVNGEKKRYMFKEIKIPGNMDIFATMNTSDQNVYTLDTAFVRRWDREKIMNSFEECSFASMPVPGMEGYTWQEFVEGINACIVGHLDDLQINEDKQIGAFFVKESLLGTRDAEKFAYKVFDYLWNDVAKLNHEIFFNQYATLESLIATYKTKGVGVFRPGIFEGKETAQTQEDDSDEK